jgi:F-box and WD-40 domain protein 1/11
MARPLGNPRTFPASLKASMATNPAFKLDEGYSEETRSQSDGDAAMRVDMRMADSNDTESVLQMALPDDILNLSEIDRSGA